MTTIFSLGSFYIGIDDEKFNDIQIHLGKLRIEYTGPSIKSNNGSSSPSSDGQEDGETDESNQSPPTL